ncbi:MAG: hypothetical protein UH071_08410 [Paludibacteraceae bacterium]|nr:hypothetical protein [Paludibacteraceae bacterium]
MNLLESLTKKNAPFFTKYCINNTLDIAKIIATNDTNIHKFLFSTKRDGYNRIYDDITYMTPNQVI